jgi:protein-disulfide isomerase
MDRMKTKQILFWSGYIILIGLLTWWLTVTIIKAASGGTPKINTPTIDIPENGAPAEVTSADHIRGPVDAPVTLIEYGDFECRLCSEYATIVKRLAAEYTGTLRIVFRHYPLLQHSNAMIAAEASEAAAINGKFWEMYDVLNANQASWADLPEHEIRSVLAGYAVRLGLDERQFLLDLESPAVKQKIERDHSGGMTIPVYSTPTFFVNGSIIKIPRDYEQFKAVIDAAHNK